ncbi:MAG: hypothetical protein LBQ37_02605 [Elusimicrobiota bacterium]|nr:hypothetical protein [Elusimicrobiota bacterium]
MQLNIRIEAVSFVGEQKKQHIAKEVINDCISSGIIGIKMAGYDGYFLEGKLYNSAHYTDYDYKSGSEKYLFIYTNMKNGEAERYKRIRRFSGAEDIKKFFENEFKTRGISL